MHQPLNIDVKIMVSVHLLEKWRHFVSPKRLLRFRVSVRSWGYLKYVFGQTCFRARVVDPKIKYTVNWPRLTSFMSTICGS